MSDFYEEQLVKRKPQPGNLVIKICLVILTVVSFGVIFLFPLGIIVPIGLIALDVYLFQRMDLEYEYTYCNGELVVDKIMGKARRKNVVTVDVHEMEMLAPRESSQARPKEQMKTMDFTSREPGKKVYAMILDQNNRRVKLLLEPDESILKGIRMIEPRKVID